MTTIHQTITIEMLSSPYTFYGMEPAPICPHPYTTDDKDEFIVMKVKDKSVITWWKNNLIIKILPDGTTKTWVPKPTLEKVVKGSLLDMNGGWYYKFNSDGSVVAKHSQALFYWSGSIPGKAEVGERLTQYEYDSKEYEDEEAELLYKTKDCRCAY
jgi:hypothetical protein